MDTPKPAETPFFDEHRDEIKDLAKAVGENKPEAMATAAGTLFTKVLLASLTSTAPLAAPAAAMAGAVIGKRFGQWFADNPTARLQAADLADKKRRAQRAQLKAIATVMESVVTEAVQPVLAGLTNGKQVTEDSFNVLADGMCEALDGLTRVEAGILRLESSVSSVHELLCRPFGGKTSQWPSAWNFAPVCPRKARRFRRSFVGI